MEYDFHQLTAAILKLSETSWYNSAFFIAILTTLGSIVGVYIGALLAIRVFRIQQELEREREKIYAVNNAFLLVSSMLSNLLRIKGSCSDIESDDPRVRLRSVPYDIGIGEKVCEDVTQLAFVVYSGESHKKQSWGNLARISSMFGKYNLLKNVCDERKELCIFFYEKLVNVTKEEEAIQVIQNELNNDNVHKMSTLIELNEFCIKLTDDLLLEVYDFMYSFPQLAGTLIENEAIDAYGPLLVGFETEPDGVLEIKKKTPRVNYDLLIPITGRTIDEQIKGLQTGYESFVYP